VLALLIGRMKLEAGDAAGIAETERAVGLAERIVSLPGAELNDRRSLGATLAEYGGILAVVKDDQPAAVAARPRHRHSGDAGAAGAG
jgi:hypothetical protein